MLTYNNTYNNTNVIFIYLIIVVCPQQLETVGIIRKTNGLILCGVISYACIPSNKYAVV